MKLKKLFEDYVASSSFKKIDGEIRIVGKFGQVSLSGDSFDIWFVSEPPLTPRKLSAIQKNIPIEVGFTRLDTEAYIQTSNISIILKLLPICGIKRKKRISKESIIRLIKQLDISNEISC